MRAAHLEISLRQSDDGDYIAETRFQAADSRSEAHLIDSPLPRLRFDIEQLLALSLNHKAYGRLLGEMFFADHRLLEALDIARTHAEAVGVPLRISLRLDPSYTLLHGLRWETLHDPRGGGALFATERMLLSRYLDSPAIQPVTSRSRGSLSALIVVAGPQDLPTYGLSPIDVAAEVTRAQSALTPMATTVLASGGERPVTLSNLRAALNDLPDILYLVCHGTSPMGQATLWLERDEGQSARVEGEVFVRQIASLSRRPMLIVLASCQSAGQSHDAGTLAAVAPRLAREGIAAVVAMQGNISQGTVAAAMPIFFHELLRDGQIDRALASARAAVLHHDDWWSLMLVMRVRDGRLWLEETAYAGDGAADSLARRSRQRLLQHMRDYWIKGVLEGSLHGAALIELGLEARPDYVAYPWDMVVERPGRAPQGIPAGTALTKVFDDAGGELLILGSPGSGKTTTLLELARRLLVRAEGDERARIPAIFHLSLWAESRLPLRDWLESELENRYGVPKSVAVDWITGNQIHPLLDGLDEVKLEHRNACVVAINDFWKEYGAGVVVCSRTADYESLSERFRLRGAVLIQPLNDSQIEAYLLRIGDQLSGLREVLPTDAALRELADSPLMLSMMTLAYQGKRPEEIRQQAEGENRQNQLFATYVQRMLTRPRAGENIAPERVISQLSWLARGMVQHNLSVFYLDELQPTWIGSRQGTIAYAIGSSLLILLVAIIGGYLLGAAVSSALAAMLIWSTLWDGSWWYALALGGVLGSLAGGVAAGLHLGISAPDFGLYGVLGRIYTVRRAYWRWGQFLAPVQLNTDLRNGIAFGAVSGGLAGITFSHFAGKQLQQVSDWVFPSTTLFRQSIISIFTSLILALAVVFIGAILQRLRISIQAQIVDGNRIASAFSWLFFSVTSGSLQSWAVVFAFSFLFALVMNTNTPLDNRLIGGLSISVVGAIIVALFVRFVACVAYNSSWRRSANEVQIAPRLLSIWPNVLLLGVAASIIGSILGNIVFRSVCMGVFQESESWMINTVSSTQFYPGCVGKEMWTAGGGILGGVATIVFGTLSHGAKSLLQHFWLRVVIALSNGLMFRSRTLLDAAADRVLLRKVGAGYLFIHRLVLEYFAELNPVQTVSLLGSLSWAIIERGIALRDLGRLDEALATFTHALELEPGNSKAASERGLTYRRFGRHEEALQDFERVVRLEPDRYWARVQLGISLRSLHRYDDAIAEFSNAIRLETKPAWAYMERAMTYQAAERNEEAISDASRAIGMFPKRADWYLQRGIIYRSSGQLSNSLQDLTTAVDLRPSADWILVHRSITLRNMGRIVEALSDMQRAVEIDPEDGWNRGHLASLYRDLDRYDDALEQHERQIRLQANKPWPYAEQAETYQRMKRYSDALHNYSQALSIDPEYSWARLRRASVYRALERYDEALTDYSQVLRLRPTWWAYDERAMLYRLLGHFDKALDDHNQVLALLPDKAWPYIDRAITYRAMQSFEEALADLSQAINIDAENEKAYAERGEIYSQIGDCEQALNDLSKSISINPTRAWPYDERAVVYRFLGNNDKAFADHNQAISLEPDRDWSLCQRGITHHCSGNDDLARADFEQAIELAKAEQAASPTDRTNLLNLVVYLLASGRGSEAEALARSTVAGGAVYAELTYAIRDMREYLQFFPEEPSVTEILAILNGGLEILSDLRDTTS